MELKFIYVAGIVTDGGRLPVADARNRFAEGCREVQALGYNAISPMEIARSNGLREADEGGNHPWLAFMKCNIRTLLECDGIYLLRGWENSRGARLEKLIADGLGMLILYQDERSENTYGRKNS